MQEQRVGGGVELRDAGVPGHKEEDLKSALLIWGIILNVNHEYIIINSLLRDLSSPRPQDEMSQEETRSRRR